MRGFVTPKYVNEASDKGGASLKDEAGVYWYIPDDMPSSQFQANTTYDVVYSQATSKASGKQYNKIVELLASNVPPGGGSAPPEPTVAQGQPAAPQAVNRPTQASEGDKTPMRIFCCGVVQNAMSSGDFTPDHIDPLTASAKAAFEKYLQ